MKLLYFFLSILLFYSMTSVSMNIPRLKTSFLKAENLIKEESWSKKSMSFERYVVEAFPDNQAKQLVEKNDTSNLYKLENLISSRRSEITHRKGRYREAEAWMVDSLLSGISWGGTALFFSVSIVPRDNFFSDTSCILRTFAAGILALGGIYKMGREASRFSQGYYWDNYNTSCLDKLKKYEAILSDRRTSLESQVKGKDKAED